MEWLFWTILGAAVAAALDSNLMIGGAVIGLIIGLIRQARSATRNTTLAQRLQQLETEVAQLRQRVGALENGPGESMTSAPPPPLPDEILSLDLDLDPDEMLPPLARVEPVAPARAGMPDPASAGLPPEAAPPGLPVHTAHTPATPISPPQDDHPATPRFDPIALARAWLFGGNTLVRVGMLVLFFGFVFLAKFAVDHAILPVEVRLAGVAVGGLALLLTGWRLRLRRSAYALILQGGGVAVLYLTVFSALRLFALLPPTLAFALLVAMVVCSALLALLQNAPALAMVATAGGFAAPILTSTGSGGHVALFSYYALLDAGVLFLAWHRAWRPLNLLAFVCTLVIGAAWGSRYYHPDFLSSTMPFLLLYWAMFIAAAVFYCRNAAPRLRHVVDGSLVFGVPVCSFALLSALLHGIPFALAYAAVAASAIYLALARLLWQKPAYGLLGESFAGLGIAFLTLAVPLALDPRWTAAAWALEGSALVWTAMRQERRLALFSGLALQLAAAASLSQSGHWMMDTGHWPFLNAECLDQLLLAIAALFSGACCARWRNDWALPRGLQWAALVWGGLWWLQGGMQQSSQLPAPAIGILLWFALSGVLAQAISHRVRWPALASAAPLPLLGMLLCLSETLNAEQLPLDHLGWLAWPLATAAHAWTLHKARREDPPAIIEEGWHSVGMWALWVCLSWDIGQRVGAWAAVGTAWGDAASTLPALCLLALAPRWRMAQGWPARSWPRAYSVFGPALPAVWLALWCAVVNTIDNGAASPLPYLPLLNPLDLAIGLALLLLWRWLDSLPIAELPRHKLRAGLAVLAFLAANGALLRALHHALALPYTLHALLRSDTVEACLALFWSLLALAVMLIAHRRAARSTWMVGAGLLGLTVAKLFLIDMANSGTVARIVAFIGAGVLLLLIGYFSPLPPKREDRHV